MMGISVIMHDVMNDLHIMCNRLKVCPIECSIFDCSLVEGVGHVRCSILLCHGGHYSCDTSTVSELGLIAA